MKSQVKRKKYAICGVSHRAIYAYVTEMTNTFGDVCEIVAMLDNSAVSFEICKKHLPVLQDVPEFMPDEFDKMISETKPDTVLITSQDNTHLEYILRTLKKDIDVIVEKPMVTTSADCQRVIEAEEKSKGKVTVTFNYRYSPTMRKMKEIVLAGKLGRITSVDCNWYVDTRHGASYMQRWNRMRENSGGLSIHKCVHHFDLISWIINQKPVEVTAYGDLNYYGAGGEKNPSRKDGRSCDSCTEADKCVYRRRWFNRGSGKAIGVKDDHIDAFVKKKKSEPGKLRHNACIFDSEITIEDTYAVIARYSKKAMLNYSVNFSCPFEGYRIAINGTEGRLETTRLASRGSYDVPKQIIEYYPLFGSGRETIEIVKREGSHGGGDSVLYEDLFLGPDPSRPYEISAGAREGACGVTMGEAVWRSVKEKQPVKIKEL